MKFSREVLPRVYGPLDMIIWLGGLAAVALMFLAAFRLLSPSPAAAEPPTPTSALAALPAEPTTPAPAATATPTAAVAATETPPPPTEPPPTPVPTATWFYVIPAQPTPIPTPVLPAAAPFPESCDGPGRMNILIIGIDGFSAQNHRPARADAIIVVGVNFGAREAQMLAVPRDLWLQMPNLPQAPEARINTAYHYGELYQVPGGGPAQMRATLANAFGLRIDRFVVVNFLAFEQGVDAIGGIDIHIPKPIHDSRYPLRDGSGTIAIDFPAGDVHLDGRAALIYARVRHDSSDFQRMRRQQQVLFAIRDKLLSPAALPHLPALAQVLYGSVRTDLSPEDVALLGCAGIKIRREAIQTTVISGNQVQAKRLETGAQVLVPNMDAILPVLEKFNAGE